MEAPIILEIFDSKTHTFIKKEIRDIDDEDLLDEFACAFSSQERTVSVEEATRCAYIIEVCEAELLRRIRLANQQKQG